MSLVKKIVIVPLLFVLVYSQVGYYFFYAYHQYVIKQQVKHQILQNMNEDELAVFTENNKNIRWEDDGKECSIDGKMYDVVKIKIINNTKYYYCFNDDKETELLKNYYHKIAQQHQSSKQKKDKEHQLSFQLLAVINDDEILNCFFANDDAVQFLLFNQNAINKSISKVYQPPKFNV